MTVTAVRKDPADLSMTLTAEFDASPERVWQLWADPRQLERWWGPPTYPATVTAHDLAPGAPLRNEACSFQHRDVFLHGRETHGVVARKLGNALLAGDRAAHDVAPGRVCEGGEDGVDVLRGLH